MKTEVGAMTGMQVGLMLEEDQEKPMRGVVGVIVAGFKEIWEGLEMKLFEELKEVSNHLEEVEGLQEIGTSGV